MASQGTNMLPGGSLEEDESFEEKKNPLPPITCGTLDRESFGYNEKGDVVKRSQHVVGSYAYIVENGMPLHKALYPDQAPPVEEVVPTKKKYKSRPPALLSIEELKKAEKINVKTPKGLYAPPYPVTPKRYTMKPVNRKRGRLTRDDKFMAKLKQYAKDDIVLQYEDQHYCCYECEIGRPEYCLYRYSPSPCYSSPYWDWTPDYWDYWAM